MAPVDEYPEEMWNDMLSVMLTAPFLLTKRFVPAMKQKRETLHAPCRERSGKGVQRTLRTLQTSKLEGFPAEFCLSTTYDVAS